MRREDLSVIHYRQPGALHKGPHIPRSNLAEKIQHNPPHAPFGKQMAIAGEERVQPHQAATPEPPLCAGSAP